MQQYLVKALHHFSHGNIGEVVKEGWFKIENIGRAVIVTDGRSLSSYGMMIAKWADEQRKLLQLEIDNPIFSRTVKRHLKNIEEYFQRPQGRKIEIVRTVLGEAEKSKDNIYVTAQNRITLPNNQDISNCQ